MKKTRKQKQSQKARRAPASAAAGRHVSTAARPITTAPAEACQQAASQGLARATPLVDIKHVPRVAAAPQLLRFMSFNADDRQAMVLLLLPFLMMACAIGFAQSMRSGFQPAEMIARSPAAPAETTRDGHVLPNLKTPAIAIGPPPVTLPVDVATADVGAERRNVASLDTLRDPAGMVSVVRSPDSVAPVSSDAAGVIPAALDADVPRQAEEPISVSPNPPTPWEVPFIATPSVSVAAAEETPTVLAQVPAITTDLAELVQPEPARQAALDVIELPVLTEPDSADPIRDEVAQCVAKPVVKLQLVSLAPEITADPEVFGVHLAKAARQQTNDFVIYNDKYRRISYPMGDVPPLYGVCTDVVIRAYRAVGIDLQELIHTTKVGSGDTNIDHRRVDTMRKFFSLYGESLPPTAFAEDYKPGDIVSYYRPQNRHSRTHIAVVSDMIGASGRPMIIHNRGWGPQEEDALFVDEITGHYRFSGLKSPLAAEPPKRRASTPQSKRPQAAGIGPPVVQTSLGVTPAVR